MPCCATEAVNCNGEDHVKNLYELFLFVVFFTKSMYVYLLADLTFG